MSNTRVKISSIVQDQLPDFVKEEYPLVGEFLKEYYTSLENQGSVLDIINNLDKYLNLDDLCKVVTNRYLTINVNSPQNYFEVQGGYSNDDLIVFKNGTKLLKDIDYFTYNNSQIFLTSSAVSGDILEFITQNTSSTFLTSQVDFIDDTINVSSTYGFPEKNGLIQINSEIILYTSKTENTFTGCRRGFSGVTSYRSTNKIDELTFSTSEVSSHDVNSKVTNLSSLFLQEFLLKIKRQLIPGFENKELTEGINQKNFIKQSRNFYSSKGTDSSYKFIFKALFGEEVEVIKPRDFLLKPSDSQYRIVKDLVVEVISGDPSKLENKTLYQDETNYFPAAYGTITKVEKIVRKNKEYHVLSLDYDYNKDIDVEGTIFGNFSINPSTRSLTETTAGDYSIIVDSTIGFPSSGELTLNVNGIDYTILYYYKNISQFFLSSALSVNIPENTDIKFNNYVYSYDGDSQIKVRITGVLSDISYDSSATLMSKDDNIKVSSLGYKCKNTLPNTWLFNVANTYRIKKIIGPISSNFELNTFSYTIETYDSNNLSIGDIVDLLIVDNPSVLSKYNVLSVDSENSFKIEGAKIENKNLKYSIKRNIKKARFLNFPILNNEVANTQNVYVKNDNEELIYVASNCLPNYSNEVIEIKPTNIIFSGSFDGEILDLSSGNPKNIHGLYTGDSVELSSGFNEESYSLNLENKVYYVKRVDSTKIKLSNSKEDLYNSKFITVFGTTENSVLTKLKFKNFGLSSQSFVKKLSLPTNSKLNEETPVGPIGLFVNGVEAYSYKSSDKIYYGGITSIDVLDGGKNYDVISPPIITIEDSTGKNASAIVQVNGSLEKINVIDGGFDYISDPIITITGGNGVNASAKANLISFRHSIEFDARNYFGFVDLSNNTIAFSSYHKFRDFEKVTYLSQGSTTIGGLTDNAEYYVNVQDAYKIKLHKTINDASLGINTINLTSYGSGIQKFESNQIKRKISSISILNSGSDYQNKKITCLPGNINIFNDTVNIDNHGYNNGDIILYENSGSPIGGLINNTSYYVTLIDKDSFKLSYVGIGSTEKDFYYRTNQFINLTSIGSSHHTFNYPKITVTINGKIGVSTLSGQDFSAKIQPIFKGKISGIFVNNSGVGYGSSEVINYERQPKISLNTGSGAQISPIINNGKIVEVLILNKGNNYTSAPNINISGVGTGAVLTPIVENGKINEVKIINGGVGFNTVGTILNVVSSGEGFSGYSRIKYWTINNVEKYLLNDQILDDDGVVERSQYTQNNSQYCHLYAPRKLRKSVFGIDYVDGKKTYVVDLKLRNGIEIDSTVHSPIIGWAYDGNPIYGPYGYSNPNGTGRIREMVSGYNIQPSSQRPNPISSSGEKIYPEGFFVEDYTYNYVGDLDEHNGRFCVTPEYPNGVYAYFTTINNVSVESDGVFKNYKKPVFPYIVGNTFKSDIIEFNYNRVTQLTFDFIGNNLLRNTTPYALSSGYSQYNFIFDPTRIKEPISKIRSSSKGSISNIGILTGGSGYKIGDTIIFDGEDLSSFGAYGKVSFLKGKPIKTISFASTTFQNIEFYQNVNGNYIGFSTIPHNLSDRELISIAGINKYSKIFNGFYQVGIKSNTITLSNSVANSTITGIITYFNVNGSLEYLNIRENDIYKIDDEKIKILSVDKASSRIKVSREYDSTTGTAHTTSTILYEQTRKFTFTSPNKKFDKKFDLNKEIYFDPKESLAIGSSSGVGIGSTLYFSNPGVGITNIFVPTKTIYLPNHSLKTGDELIYSSNGGFPFYVSDDGSSIYQLQENQIVYAAKVSDNLIGISTFKVGLGSDGSFVGIDSSISTSTLYFNSIGSGQNHSFKTNYEDILLGEVAKNVVTVATASSHGLKNNDLVDLSCFPGISTTIFIKYDDTSRRLVVNPKSFESTDVDIIKNTISIPNHGYLTGQKIIYTSNTPISGLVNNQIYYIVTYNKDKFKLSSTYYNATKDDPETINFLSSSDGKICPINPNINVVANQIITFDVSDTSLSFTKDLNSYPAFELKFYKDLELTEEFDKDEDSEDFNVVRNGKIGVDSFATVKLFTKNLKNNLYYSLKPIDLSNNSPIKKEIISDNDNINNSRITLIQSYYSGVYNISGVGQTTFSYNVLESPEKNSYSDSESEMQYYTNSKTASGEIYSIDLKFQGSNYNYLPGISTVSSDEGTSSILKPKTYSIGKIKKVDIEDIGFEYPSDLTLRPSAKLPQILSITPSSTFSYIGVSSVGKNYTLSPNLVVLDSYTNEIVSDVDLYYNISTKKVEILKNTDGIYNVTPRIIPINNSNGISISNISFDANTKDVTVELGVSFSYGDTFPFEVGDRILIENVNVQVSSSPSKGFNSKEYNYTLFTVKSVDPQYGGFGATVVYNLSNYLEIGEEPGIFDSENSAGTITPEKYFPIFYSVLKKGTFLVGEDIISDSSYGKVIEWNKYSEDLKVSTNQSFRTGSVIRGKTSNAKGIITEVKDLNAFYSVGASSIVKKGWNKETGFLNNKFQVTPNNDYYQYFSYSIKSKVDYETWNSSIGNMNHTAGFKKFSDIVLESTDLSFTGISTYQEQGDFYSITDLSREIDVNCVYDYDLASEKTLRFDSESISKEIIFNSVPLKDEFQAVGNRVLSIDDISDQFSNTPNFNNYANVDYFYLTDFASKKYVVLVKDKRYTDLRQMCLVSILHDGIEGYINQYSKVHNNIELGNFDFSILESEGILRFYPINYLVNDYDISYFSYGLKYLPSGIGNTSIGNISKIKSSTATLPSGTDSQTNILSIPSTFRTSKILVQLSSSNASYFQFDELILINDGSGVSMAGYGQLSNLNRNKYDSAGLGTYFPYISGSNINLDFIPNVSLGNTYFVNAIEVSIASTNTTAGSSVFDTTEVKSNHVYIPPSLTPTPTKISYYAPNYSGAYCFISIEDITNNNYQSSEVVFVNDGSEVYFVEFGSSNTLSELGTFSAGIGSTSTDIYFTPNSSIAVNVRTYQNAIGNVDVLNTLNLNNLGSASLESGYSSYQGIYNSIKKSFDLYHKEIPIFQRTIDSSDTSVVNIEDNLIKLPKHFFVTGEEVVYSPSDGTRIGIATTTISGIGVTDKLPSSLFIIKISDLNIRFADSAENALKSIPQPLILTSVGTGSTHTFTSKKQNNKCLISVDNYIQSPIVSTSTTTLLSQSSQLNEITFTISGITSIFGGDLLKINNEIVKINVVGFGSTNVILVDRGWMGTNPENHSSGSLVTKIVGNYNIVDNTIHFVEAPYGNSPIGTITNPPSDRDYTGITTRSTFSGRVFVRSGIENSSNETYSNNYIFDGITDQFTGLTTQFTLKSEKQDVVGISTGGSIILINSIFQEPQRLGVVNISGNYSIKENTGISTISFVGGISSTSYDINTASIPRGGVIVSVASTPGFGYQPLISAGGTSIVSSAGTISSINVSYTGSGYRTTNKYEIITETSTPISLGSTIININNTEGVFEKLRFSNSNTIGIGSIFVDVPIVSIGNTYVLIGAGYTSNKVIDKNELVLITINSPSTGFVNVGVKTYSTGVSNYEFIGFSTISSGSISSNIIITNPGSGYTSSNPPLVVFDSPLGYYNIPLVYANGYSGIGTSATVDIVVGQGSSVIDFRLNNLGYGYKTSEVLTVPYGGLSGIPTDLSKPFTNFELTIDETFFDQFIGWTVGDLQVIDKIEHLFNGVRRKFPIKIDGVQTSFRAKPGSDLDIQSNLLIFINDILQVPGSSYNFNGGSVITFIEAPKEGDSCKIIFYKGTESVDVIFNDILESIKPGDEIVLNNDSILLQQDERLVTEIVSSDTLETNTYPGPGFSYDELLMRPVTWCRQSEDKIINGIEVAKDRSLYEASIQPSTNIIQNVSIGSTEIFVKSLKIFFDDIRENSTNTFKSKILITSQDNVVGASASAIVSSSGTISSIVIDNGGFGFSTSPQVTISGPNVGFGSTSTALSSITSGIVTSISIVNSGSGYTSSNPPLVLIEYPSLVSEKIEEVTYEGDFGIVVGISTQIIGISSLGVVFDLFVPTDSYLRNININSGISTTGISGIKTDYYFTIFNSNIGYGITSLNTDSSIIGIGTTCLDNVYKVSSVSIAQTSVPGVGLTYVSRVVSRVSEFNGLVGTGFSNFYGEFSWGKINATTRKNPKNFNSYTNNGVLGISTSAIVQRFNPLKYIGYSSSL